MMDNVAPPSARRAAFTVLVLAVVAAFGVLLFGGYIPGLKPDYSQPSTTQVEGHSYYWMQFFLTPPLPPFNSTSPSAVTFHNNTFEIWVSSWYSPLGGEVHGNVSEPNGTHFAFALGGPPELPTTQNLTLSPDREVGASWNRLSPWVELLVLSNDTI